MFVIILNFTFCSEVKVPFQRNTDDLTSSIMTMAYNPLLVPMDLDEDSEEEEYDSEQRGTFFQ